MNLQPVEVTLLQIEKLRSSAKNAADLIPAERYKKMMSYRQEEDRLRCFGASLLMKKAIGGRRLNYNEFGKPFVIDRSFNISHSGNYAVLAEVAAKISVGVDIEKIILPVEDFAKDALTSEEYKLLTSAENFSPEKFAEKFYTFWTRKESLVKCEGQGFVDSPAEVETLSAEDGAPVFYRGKFYGISSMKICGHILSVALEENFPSCNLTLLPR